MITYFLSPNYFSMREKIGMGEKMENRNRKKGKCERYGWQIWNATTLKLIAAALMFLDHIHQMFAHRGAPLALTMAGRAVFPIFLFAAADSFHYTHSKRGYLKRLLFASWGMTGFTFLLQIAALLLLSGISYAAGGGIQWMMCFAAIPMALYNGERGRGMKNFFSLFAPEYMGVRYLLSAALF